MAGGAQDTDEAITGINVTPLVDVTLVLLIIFMVTTKIVMNQTVPLDLPEGRKGDQRRAGRLQHHPVGRRADVRRQQAGRERRRHPAARRGTRVPSTPTCARSSRPTRPSRTGASSTCWTCSSRPASTRSPSGSRPSPRCPYRRRRTEVGTRWASEQRLTRGPTASIRRCARSMPSVRWPMTIPMSKVLGLDAKTSTLGRLVRVHVGRHGLSLPRSWRSRPSSPGCTRRNPEKPDKPEEFEILREETPPPASHGHRSAAGGQGRHRLVPRRRPHRLRPRQPKPRRC